MNVVNVQPQTFRHYADISEGMAAAVAVAGAIDQAAVISAAVPVFGLIGQEFLLSFAYAQANHCTALGELVANYAATAHTARVAAQSYELTDRTNAESFVPPVGALA
ncbi:excreted virulence factor EspC (type VII ESX diderm) [Nocardia tenerifensis]|uniref:Excreted virulence factor EspC (Type VII ESX diderm) n=1 Tax=Nocardia tenerifensis TaxID=228006 RepID=A0A318JW67_9NOCA|nr:type VII secretion target [Nocardia tenerifensis]PXX61703.1 excreted virulence factor EspC (type VII ESX diderm) [Nocardia tenerifensis]